MLANAAGAAHGMAQVKVELARKRRKGDQPLVGISNLGVLTRGTLLAQQLLAERGYEALVFHAVGTGGRAMELMMRQGIIGAVFDYAMGEISDELFHGLRAGGPERLTVAGALGLPQVIVPGGAEHVGHPGVHATRAARSAGSDHKHVWHNEVVLAPRLNAARAAAGGARGGQAPAVDARQRRADAAAARHRALCDARAARCNDPAGDAIFFAELKAHLPPGIEVVERAAHAEDPAFVAEAVDWLIALVERR